MEQMVKTYSGFFKNSAAKKFEKDAAKLAKEGWKIQSQSATGSGAYIARVLTVVYTRE